MNGNADSLYFLSHTLVKTSLKMDDPAYFNAIIKNEDPLFFNVSANDYRLDTLSPAINKGDPAIALESPFDLLNNSRLNNPDAGAYQFMPGQVRFR
ncbi:MAG: hypothetical protein KKF98_00205, partial [Bacteroidetes bacterium]|nr:hypothetical protein [Bacteroidota bacterium]